MIKNKTLLVLGAGASAEANFPDGAKLKREIADLLNLNYNGIDSTTGDRLILQSIISHARSNKTADLTPYLEAASSIRDGMPQARSIDSYIDHHNENKYVELCGKLAIVRAILRAEQHSWLYVNPANFKSKPNFSSLEQTWFNTFFQIVAEGCRAPALRERLSSMALVIFNYDRCVEQFIYYSLINYYKIPAPDAADLVNSIEIYHPYGTVGHLPWQKGGPTVPFGADLNANDLLIAAEKILTFTEGTDAKSSEILAIREKVQESTFFIFLGFAFHKLNMDLLFHRPRQPHSSTKCYATAYSFSDSDKLVVSKKLSNLVGVPHRELNIRSDLKCNEFLHAYFRSLSLE